MNIWIFNHYAITPDLPGGTRHCDLGHELLRKGYDVTIFASRFRHSERWETKLSAGESWRMEDADGVKFVWLRTFPYKRNDWRRVLNMVSYMFRTWWLGRRLPRLDLRIKKPDVIIGSSVHLLAVLSAYWVARHYKAKFIMEVRDLWPQTIVDMGELSARNLIIKWLRILERFLYRRAERIIVLAPRMGEYISARGISEGKIVWIPNGVDLARFEDTQLQSPSGDEFKVMYLGAHGQANALDVLLQAARIVQDQGSSDICFILIGDGPEKSRLIKLAEELGLNNVAFCNPVKKTQIYRALYDADATVISVRNSPHYNRYGISPNKLFDYMAAKKPVIFASRSTNNPVAESDCGLTVPPRNPQALAEAIIKLYRMPKEEREAMGHRGRVYVEKHHDISVLARKLIQCIEGGLVR